MNTVLGGMARNAVTSAWEWVECLRGIVDPPPIAIHARALRRTIVAGWPAIIDDDVESSIGADGGVAIDPITAAIAGLAEVPDGRGDRPEFEPTMLLRGAAAAAAALAMLEAATGWGVRDVIPDRSTAMLLEGHSMSRARKFDVINAARFARAAALFGVSPLFADEFGQFALGLQARDGGFLSSRDLTEAAQVNPALGIMVRCATATQVLWTLAELADPAFRLMRHVTGRERTGSEWR